MKECLGLSNKVFSHGDEQSAEWLKTLTTFMRSKAFANSI